MRGFGPARGDLVMRPRRPAQMRAIASRTSRRNRRHEPAVRAAEPIRRTGGGTRVVVVTRAAGRQDGDGAAQPCGPCRGCGYHLDLFGESPSAMGPAAIRIVMRDRSTRITRLKTVKRKEKIMLWKKRVKVAQYERALVSPRP